MLQMGCYRSTDVEEVRMMLQVVKRDWREACKVWVMIWWKWRKRIKDGDEGTSQWEKVYVSISERRKMSILQQEVPIDLNFVIALRTPAEAEHALASFFTASLRFAPVDIPHPESYTSRCMDNNFVFLWTSKLLHLVRIDITNVDVRVTGHSRRDRDNRWTARLCQAYIPHNPVRETSRKADLTAGWRSMNVAFEVWW